MKGSMQVRADEYASKLADALNFTKGLDAQNRTLEGQVSKLNEDLLLLRAVKKARGVADTRHQCVQTQPEIASDNGIGEPLKPVQLKMTLDLDFSAAGAEGSVEREQFKLDVATDLANAPGRRVVAFEGRARRFKVSGIFRQPLPARIH